MARGKQNRDGKKGGAAGPERSQVDSRAVFKEAAQVVATFFFKKSKNSVHSLAARNALLSVITVSVETARAKTGPSY
ncbi:MAG: hypothetical protein JW741_04580 [Sedimentisphaerales bacterium]|nr:hypothetical protein [Sedimentisphaerales bacterium]